MIWLHQGEGGGGAEGRPPEPEPPSANTLHPILFLFSLPFWCQSQPDAQMKLQGGEFGGGERLKCSLAGQVPDSWDLPVSCFPGLMLSKQTRVIIPTLHEAGDARKTAKWLKNPQNQGEPATTPVTLHPDVPTTARLEPDPGLTGPDRFIRRAGIKVDMEVQATIGKTKAELACYS